ncbi:MAG: DUF1127 domain-containing protein [Pseudomonadota bacterium]
MSFVRRYQDWASKRRARQVLSQLSPRQLEDIGLAGADLPRAEIRL